MIMVLALCFVIVHLLPWTAVRLLGRGGARDPFGPLGLLTALNLLSAPYLLLMGLDRGYVAPATLASPWVHDLPGALAAFVLLSCLGFLALVAGLHSRLGPALARAVPRLHVSRFTRGRCYTAAVLVGGAGIMMYLYFLTRIGGLANLWKLLYNRSVITAGTGYISTAYTLLLTFAVLLLAYSLRFPQSRARRAGVVATIVLVAAVLASTGGRSGAVTLIFFAAMVGHYCVRRFRRLLTPKTVLAGGVLFVFILVMPLFRTSSAYERYTENPALLARDAFRNLAYIAPQLSGVDRGLVVVGYFDRFERLWWGASYRDLLSAPIPRTLMPEKPPVDEGVYLLAIAHGNHVRPSMPANRLPISSWPPGQLILFMNFWFPGYLLGMYLFGAVIGAAYRYMQLSGYSPVSVYMYGFALFGGFALSNYSIVMALLTVGFTTGVFWLLFARKGLGRWWGAPVRPPLAPRGA